MKNTITNLLLICVIHGLGYSQSNLETMDFVAGNPTVPLEINLVKTLTGNISLRAQIDNMDYAVRIEQASITQHGRICDWFNFPARLKNLDALVKYQSPHSLRLDEASLIFLSGHPILNNINKFASLLLRKILLSI